MKYEQVEGAQPKENAIRGNYAAFPEFSAPVQDLADLLVELALRQLASEKQLQAPGKTQHEK